jgi:4-hydroxyphenylacetate 3-monooxygenase
MKTGEEYRETLRDGREVYIDGERVRDVVSHPAFKAAVDARARIYDLRHAPGLASKMLYVEEDGATYPRPFKLPRSKDDLTAWRAYFETLHTELGGPIERLADDAVGELWSMYDARERLAQIDPRYSANVERAIQHVREADLYHVSGNTDPKGDRSKAPGEKSDPDLLLHVVEERDDGIVVRGAKYETGAAYAHQAFVKPTIANWDESMVEYAAGFICDISAPGLKLICRSPLGSGRNTVNYPISGRFDEIDTLMVFDNVLVPWENVLFAGQPELARYIRGTLHRYAAFPFLVGLQFNADLLLGAALLNVEQTGLDKLPPVREKLSRLIWYREMINAAVSASVAEGEPSPGGLAMPNQSILYSGRIFACTLYPEMVHIVRELAGGQISLTPNIEALSNPDVRQALEKYYTIDRWTAENRMRLLYYTRDLVNSDYAGHRMTFYLFGQSPPFAHLAVLYANFDTAPMRDLVRRFACLGESNNRSGHS